jgi:DNA-binding GntR family transcriptional regulator
MSRQPSFGDAPRRLSDQLATYLRGEIYAGRLRPGQRLYEVELCERLNVSRAPLREAILTLRTDGLVEVRPHRGAIVTTLTDDDIREVFTLRRLVEPLGARAAAERADADGLHGAAAALDELRFSVQRGDPLTIAIAHSELHRAIARASGMPRLATFVDALSTQMLTTHGTGYAARPGETETLLDDHEPIVAAILTGDGEAAEQRMRDHFRPIEPMLEAYRRLREESHDDDGAQ